MGHISNTNCHIVVQFLSNKVSLFIQSANIYLHNDTLPGVTVFGPVYGLPYKYSSNLFCILALWSKKLPVLTKIFILPILLFVYWHSVCVTSSFDCLGFAYRQPQSAGEVLNCDLTDKVDTIIATMTMMMTRRTKIMWKLTMVMVLFQDTRTLDPYSSYDFYQPPWSTRINPGTSLASPPLSHASQPQAQRRPPAKVRRKVPMWASTKNHQKINAPQYAPKDTKMMILVIFIGPMVDGARIVEKHQHSASSSAGCHSRLGWWWWWCWWWCW